MPEKPKGGLGPNKREEIHEAMRELREMWEADQKEEKGQEVQIPSFLKDDKPGKIHQNNLKPDESNASETSSWIQHMIDAEKERTTPQEEEQVHPFRHMSREQRRDSIKKRYNIDPTTGESTKTEAQEQMNRVHAANKESARHNKSKLAEIGHDTKSEQQRVKKETGRKRRVDAAERFKEIYKVDPSTGESLPKPTDRDAIWAQELKDYKRYKELFEINGRDKNATDKQAAAEGIDPDANYQKMLDTKDSMSNLSDVGDTPIELLLSNEEMQIPVIYNGNDPLDNQREQGIMRHLKRETRKMFRSFLKEHKITLRDDEQTKLQNKLTRLAHIAAYMHSTYNHDDYIAGLADIEKAAQKTLKESLDTDKVSETDMRILSKHIIYKGGAALSYVKARDYTTRLDITNTADANIIQENDSHRMLSTIEQMQQGALLWYYAKLTGDPKAHIPKGMTLEKLLKEEYGKALNMRTAAIAAAMPVGAALVGGAISGGTAAPILGHLAYTAAGGAAGLTAGALWNNRGESGSKLYDAQLLVALHEFNKSLKEGMGYVDKPKMGWLRNSLNKQRSEPPSRGTAFSKLSRSDLRFILDQKVLSAKNRQKKTRLAVAATGAAFAYLPHHLASTPTAAAIPSAPTTPAPASTSPAVSSFKGWLSNFFSFNGVDGTRFPVVQIVDTLPPDCYTPF